MRTDGFRIARVMKYITLVLIIAFVAALMVYASGSSRPFEEVEDAVEVRLSKDEQLQQRRANQRLGAEVMSQRIREMSDNDPRVVALVIRQWINNDHE